jgi:hypothetical protein
MPLLAALLLTSPAAHAWGHHYLIADQSLRHPSTAYTETEVVVETLTAFLADAAGPVAAAFDAHYDTLEGWGSDRFTRQTFPVDDPSVANFLTAARLNPQSRFPLVVRNLPGGEVIGRPVSPEFASRFLREDDLLHVAIEAQRAGDTLPARRVVSTFLDEPDWGFDHSLWPYAEYGYGAQPYGNPEGESSKAPFHMQFDHENFLVKKFASKLTQGMVRDRVDLFMRLSTVAFDAGHPYWGYRFAAWAIHYVEDLTQPYHSRAVPSAGAPYYIRYVLSPRKAHIEEVTVRLASNRHFVYEDFVAYGLQQSYLEDDPLYDGLAAYLSAGEATFAGVADLDGLIAACTAPAAAHAKKIDKALVRAFGPKLTKDVDYEVETAPDYSISSVLPGVDPKRAEKLIEETGFDFGQAGLATRTVLAMVGAEAKTRAPAVEEPEAGASAE